MILCYFGDSITTGYGDPSGLGWAGRISGKLAAMDMDVTHYNLGVRKNSSPIIAKRWKAEAEMRRIEGQDFKQIFSFGTADVLNDVTTEESLAAAESILSEAKALGDVLFVGPTPVSDEASSEKIAALSKEFENLCEKLGVRYIPLVDGLMVSPVYGQALKDGDNIHPSLMGYAALAQYILQSKTARDFFGFE